MANLNIEMPDELVHALESLAAARHETVQQLALERLRSLVDAGGQRKGSPAAILQVMLGAPHLSAADVAALETAIAEGRIPSQDCDLFPD